MRFGLSEKTCDIIQNILAQHPDIESATLYGSRAMGNYRPGSDIDLTLIGPALSLKTLFAVMGELDESSIPYAVDLSIFAQIDNPNLVDHIQRVGKVFYQRTQQEEVAAR